MINLLDMALFGINSKIHLSFIITTIG